MTIREIAARAKVSTSTVSRVLNDVRTVDPRMAKRVLKIVEELGYCPNGQARALVSGRSRIFGLIITEITNPFFPEIVQVFGEIAVQHGYEILVSSTVHDPKRMQVAVRRMLERRVDGLAALTFGMEDVLLDDPLLRTMPLVVVDVGPSRSRMNNIRIDYLSGIRQGVQHLAAMGHTRIAFISGPSHLRTALARRLAFVEAMSEIALPSELIVEGDHTIEGGLAAFGRLLDTAARPTAVVCSNDMTALGVMRRSFEAGIRIPQDLSVIGFDNIRLAQFVLPPLTSVDMSQAELARLAFRALLAEVQRGAPAARGTEYQLKTNLVLRQSTARAGGSSARATQAGASS